MRYRLIFLSFIFFIILFLESCLIIEGKVSVVGNEPHNYLVIRTMDGEKDYLITGKYKEIIWNNYQNKIVKVKGKINRENKNPQFKESIKVIKIISIK